MTPDAMLQPFVVRFRSLTPALAGEQGRCELTGDADVAAEPVLRDTHGLVASLGTKHTAVGGETTDDS